MAAKRMRSDEVDYLEGEEGAGSLGDELAIVSSERPLRA
eukprot:CAMPEP_0206011618 /NCGR_PEP_ID=MMETSP1464-20131121/13537_1 /ASSEMBLY_ACC=CAM_ASM_001124 /TAXON_ID=119497 /ORGANISM="Exanthemachrysis gayraliae, Strain RCC1523" /LENGTH=38 /DNA_ID= /DNA_START= /DNA_END= /DNA_ORIENTATION=